MRVHTYPFPCHHPHVLLSSSIRPHGMYALSLTSGSLGQQQQQSLLRPHMERSAQGHLGATAEEGWCDAVHPPTHPLENPHWAVLGGDGGGGHGSRNVLALLLLGRKKTRRCPSCTRCVAARARRSRMRSRGRSR